MNDAPSDFTEYERRLAFALTRTAKGMETLVESRNAARTEVEALQAELDRLTQEAAQTAQPVPEPVQTEEAATDPATDAIELQAVRAALDEAQEKIRTLGADLARATSDCEAYEADLMRLNAEHETALDTREKRLGQRAVALTQAQAEIERLQGAIAQLTAANRSLIDATGAPASHQINEALLAELEALRAARSAETVAIDEILSGIEPLLSAHEAQAQEAQAHDGTTDTHTEESKHG